MKRLSAFAFLLVIQSVQGGEPYSFKTLEANPIPKTEAFRLLKEVALRDCPDSLKTHNVQPELCRKLIIERDPVCVKKLSHKAPLIFSKRPIAREIAKDYFECVGPGYFCYGVEVKSEEQIKNHCLKKESPLGGGFKRLQETYSLLTNSITRTIPGQLPAFCVRVYF